jgi:ATP-binding cassette subfamily C protein PrsD
VTLTADRQSKGAAKAAMESSARRQVLADATRYNADVIRALGMTGRLTARWAKANERYLQENIRAVDIYANLASAAKILRFILQSGMLGIAAYLVVIDQASGGIMIASSIMMGRALAPIEVALGTWKQLVGAREGLKRLREVLKSTAAPEAPSVQLPRPRREMIVQDVCVAAPGTDRTLVSNISFRLTAGTGMALLDGATIDQWQHDDLGRHIGYLPQDVALLDGTVAENIARFDENATSDAVLQAARISGAHEMILRLPNGYATRIGEGGTALSAGQRQRVGLARAVFGEPFLVVLDEPNANLDADGENALTRAIEALRAKHCIVIVVSHRPSALSALNVAMVLYDGKVIAFGPREEVFARIATNNAAAAVKPIAAQPQQRPARLATGVRP